MTPRDIPPPEIDTRWLEDFILLSKTLSFSQSAHIRSISTITFSRRIKALEKSLHSQLINRSTKPIQLTSQGHSFLMVAQDILQQLDQFKTNGPVKK